MGIGFTGLYKVLEFTSPSLAPAKPIPQIIPQFIERHAGNRIRVYQYFIHAPAQAGVFLLR